MKLLNVKIPQYCVLNQVPRGGATLKILLVKKWMLSCAARGELSIKCTA